MTSPTDRWWMLLAIIAGGGVLFLALALLGVAIDAWLEARRRRRERPDIWRSRGGM